MIFISFYLHKNIIRRRQKLLQAKIITSSDFLILQLSFCRPNYHNKYLYIIIRKFIIIHIVDYGFASPCASSPVPGSSASLLPVPGDG